MLMEEMIENPESDWDEDEEDEEEEEADNQWNVPALDWKANKKTLNDQIFFLFKRLRGRNSNTFSVLKAILCYKPS